MLYFDNNSTTVVAPEVADALNSAVREVFGNASSAHRAGQVARQQLEGARATIAKFINASPNEIVFTSGGTESNNLAIRGLLQTRLGHIVTTGIEHPSVLDCCRQLRDVSVVKPGEIDGAIRDDTVLVSVMHGNNETGSVQDVVGLASLVRERRASGQEIYLHSDGVQALGKIPVDVMELGVDLYSMSAHKVYGPKGVGALFVRKGVPVRGIQAGGRHERERRAGTENVPGILAFARALELCDSPSDVAELRNHFEDEISRRLDGVEINGRDLPRLPNTSNVLFRGLSAEALVIALDMRGMAVSAGSACSSGSIEPSHVLLATGLTREEAKSSVRFSFGRYNTLNEVQQLADAVVACARRLRSSKGAEVQVAG